MKRLQEAIKGVKEQRPSDPVDKRALSLVRDIKATAGVLSKAKTVYDVEKVHDMLDTIVNNLKNYF